MKKKTLFMILIVCILSSFLACDNTTKPIINEPEDIEEVTVVEEDAYYVATDGDNDNEGSYLNPWLTIQYGLNQLKPGDTLIVKEGIYYEKLVMKKSGEADKYITIKAEKNKEVIIDGTNNNKRFSMIYLENVDYLRLEGFEIRNCNKPDNDWEANIGIEIVATKKGSGSKGVQIVSNKIYNIDGETFKKVKGSPNGNGIAVFGYGNNKNRAVTDLLIEGNEVFNNKTGWSETITCNGNVDGFIIQYNYVHDNNNIGIDAIGGEDWLGFNSKNQLNRARNGSIKGNVVINSSEAGNYAYNGSGGADGIYVDGGYNITIQDNYIIGCPWGIEIASEMGSKFRPSGIIISNNIITDSESGGILLGGTKGTRDVLVENNTVYQNSYYNEPLIFLSGVGKGSSYIIKNNLFISSEGQPYVRNYKNPVVDYGSGNTWYGSTSNDSLLDPNGNKPSSLPVASLTSGDFTVDERITHGAHLTLETTPYLNEAINNYSKRLETLDQAFKIYEIVNNPANKGTTKSPLTLEDINDNLCAYFEDLPGVINSGTKVFMKPTADEEISSKNFYYGYITVGKGNDGLVNFKKISKLKKSYINNKVRIYVKVPYQANGQTSYLVFQINKVSIKLDPKKVP